MKKIIVPIIICSLMLLFSSCQSRTALKQENIDITDAIVKVNDYYILKSSIDAVYNEYKDTGISYDEIVEDTILEILVVQSSKEYGISITDKELDEIMSEFEQAESDIYAEAIEAYGEDVLREKLLIRNTFSQTKEYVLNNIILKNGITHNDIERFSAHYGLEDQLSPYSDEQILHDLQYEIEGFLFNEWMEELRENADIIYL